MAWEHTRSCQRPHHLRVFSASYCSIAANPLVADRREQCLLIIFRSALVDLCLDQHRQHWNNHIQGITNSHAATFSHDISTLCKFWLKTLGASVDPGLHFSRLQASACS